MQFVSNCFIQTSITHKQCQCNIVFMYTIAWKLVPYMHTCILSVYHLVFDVKSLNIQGLFCRIKVILGRLAYFQSCPTDVHNVNAQKGFVLRQNYKTLMLDICALQYASQKKKIKIKYPILTLRKFINKKHEQHQRKQITQTMYLYFCQISKTLLLYNVQLYKQI